MVDGIRGALVSLEARIDRRFQQIDRRFEGLDARFDSLDTTMSRQFMWLVGLIVTACIGSVGALSTVMAALLAR